MTQTAMQEAIDWVNKNYPNFNHADIEAKLTQLLEKEKQQICDAVKYGQNNHTVSVTSDELIRINYYNEQYG